ncbi:hypothetical protein DPMN_142409 [Dreissena polymorpha]|uniref:protein-tyrosine-phosphatase n=1 Tax=Dreissena polymorpha TaxID=45954 RepID=A0A9D4JIM4_DREPO|nr:hypothetical protein DPMN_142409 [Dreissena polymorpha]
MLTPNPNTINITKSAITSATGHTSISHFPAATVLRRNIKNQFHSGPFGDSQNSHRHPFVDEAPLSGESDVDVNFNTNGRDSFSLEHDPIYDNLVKKKKFRSRDIDIQNLREVDMRAKENKTEVFTEFSALSAASELIQNSTDTALKSANVAKNRYNKMYPYDNNRVKLSIIGNDIDTDFINASFIDGYSSPKKCIAAQVCQSHVPDRVEAETGGEYMMVLDGEKPDNVNTNVDPCVVPDIPKERSIDTYPKCTSEL